MSGIGRAMGKHFGGSASFREQLAALKAQHGTVTATAKALGIDRRTWQRWESGAIANPRPATTEKIGREWRSVVSGNKSTSDDAVRLSLTQTHKGGRPRQRTITGSNLKLEPGTMDHARLAYIAGGDEAAGKAFVDGIADEFWHDQFEDDLTGEGEQYDASKSDPTPTSISVS